MGAWGFYDDENDQTADEWETVNDLYLQDFPKTKFLISQEFVEHVRVHYKHWYKALRVHLLRLAHDHREWTASVMLGLIIQTVRLFTQNVNTVSGFAARIERIQKTMDEKPDAFPNTLPQHFPLALRKIAFKLLKRVEYEFKHKPEDWADGALLRQNALRQEFALFSSSKTEKKFCATLH